MDSAFSDCFEHILLISSKGLGTSSNNLLVPLFGLDSFIDGIKIRVYLRTKVQKELHCYNDIFYGFRGTDKLGMGKPYR